MVLDYLHHRVLSFLGIGWCHLQALTSPGEYSGRMKSRHAQDSSWQQSSNSAYVDNVADLDDVVVIRGEKPS